MSEFWFWAKMVGVVLLFVVLLVVGMSMKFNCCRDAGFTEEQCTYSLFCNG